MSNISFYAVQFILHGMELEIWCIMMIQPEWLKGCVQRLLCVVRLCLKMTHVSQVYTALLCIFLVFNYMDYILF